YNEVNEQPTKDKGKGKMVYEEDKIETEEERQVRNSINEKEKEETKNRHQVTEERENRSIYKEKRKRRYSEE
ncbi:5775_t:CDS:1, partial [Scutellospora calospora]